MRAPSGARPPIEKFLNDSGNEMDYNQIYEYIKDIAKYYASEYKSDNELREQLKIDLEILAQSYRTVRLLAGLDNEQNSLYEQFAVKPVINKAAEKNMKNIADTLHYLIREATLHRLFLEPKTLEKIGLRDVYAKAIDRSSFKMVDTSVYDLALLQYKIHDYVPQAPSSVMACFLNDREQYEAFYRESKGCSPEQIAANFFKIDFDADYLANFRSFKPLYDFFIAPSENAVSYGDYHTSDPVSPRTWRRYMNDAREAIL